MKKPLFTLFAICAAGMLLAQESDAKMQPSSTTKQCPPNGDRWEGFITVDFLFWYARETDLSYLMRTTGALRAPAAAIPIIQRYPKKFEYLNAKWDPGFRVGLGFKPNYNGWDVYAHWTYFKNKSQSSNTVAPVDTSASAIGQQAFTNPWMNLAYESDNSPLLFSFIKATWKLFFNSIDLEFGKSYWMGERFLLRPYTGLRGAWTRTRFNTFAENEANSILIQSNNRFKNSYWGAGFLGGFQPSWYFTKNFSLFGNLDGALIWGNMRAKKREIDYRVDNRQTTDINVDFDNRFTGNFSKMQAILDLAIGLRWEGAWKCDRFRYALSAGWEHHIWFNHNTRIKTNSPSVQAGAALQVGSRVVLQYEETNPDLTFGGLVLRLLVGF